jgi:hypothetical protein
MDRTEHFRSVMRRYGEPLASDSVHPDTYAGFEEFRATFRRILDAPSLSSREVHCDWLDNTAFNALATLNGKGEFIGVFAGCALHIYNYFLTFLSDPGVLKLVGDPRLEEPDQNAILGLQSGVVLPQFLPRNPRDPERLRAAQHLAWNAVIFLFFHELGHLALCHLRLLKDEVGATEYLELPAANLSEEEAHLRVLLEIDADQSAAVNSLRYWREMWNRKSFPALIQLGVDASWSMSIAMLFRIMDGFKAGLPEPHYTTHPPPMARYIHIVSLGAQPNTPHFYGDEEVSLNSFQEISAWWKANKLPISAGAHGVGEDVISELNTRRRELSEKYADRLGIYQEERRLKMR